MTRAHYPAVSCRYISSISDDDFTALLACFNSTSPQRPWRHLLAEVIPNITSTQRLAATLDHLTPVKVLSGSPLSSSTLGLFSDCVSKLGPSETLADAVAPHLTSTQLRMLILRFHVAGLGTLLPSPPSPTLLTRLLGLSDQSFRLADDLVNVYTFEDLVPPKWYVLRLALRVPDFASRMLDYRDVIDYPSVVALVAFIERFSPDPAATQRLLSNPSCNLAQALSATTALEVS